MTINELREKRKQAWNAAKAFVETKRDKDGLLSEEDAKTYAQMEKKVQDYGAEIERMEAMSAMEAQPSDRLIYTCAELSGLPITANCLESPSSRMVNSISQSEVVRRRIGSLMAYHVTPSVKVSAVVS